MERRTIRRALAGAMGALVLTAVVAYADTVPADGDAVTAGNQALVFLPAAAPGQVVTWPITFRLTCAGFNHAAAGSTIELELASTTVPFDGVASATTTTIGPVPDDWASGGQPCPSPAPTIASDGPSVVSLTMPSTPGKGLQFSLMWSRVGASGLTGSSAITFQVDVIGNTRPTLHLPADRSVEATSASGAAVRWSATATDAEDAAPPTPTCTPASGSTFAIGTTTVDCVVTDGGGLTDGGSFTVTVADTTAPTLVGMPADRVVTTNDPAGATVTWTPPSADDAVDPSPTVTCDQTRGRQFPVGTTTVRCTARDETGNDASASFTIDVRYSAPVPTVAWSAIWGEPVASGGATFDANLGRTVPVKVRLFADGVEQTRGAAVLSVATCGGSAVGSMSMAWGGGRWNASLETGALGGPGCYIATAGIDGHAAGSFRIDLRGGDAARPTTIGQPRGKITP